MKIILQKYILDSHSMYTFNNHENFKTNHIYNICFIHQFIMQYVQRMKLWSNQFQQKSITFVMVPWQNSKTSKQNISINVLVLGNFKKGQVYVYFIDYTSL
jgi:hypothetical protein